MSNEFQELQENWESGKKEIQLSYDQEALYPKIKRREKENYLFYYGTITILLITFSVVLFFFYFIAPVKETLSRIGVLFMLSGLLFRIIIEIVSIKRAKQINILDDTLKSTESSIKFHQFRKMIHRIIAPLVIVIYTIGFYLITPEFNSQMELWNVLLIDVSYVVIAIILFFVLRKGVKKEMQKLAEITEIKKEIVE